jgi:hypothetical protein
MAGLRLRQAQLIKMAAAEGAASAWSSCFGLSHSWSLLGASWSLLGAWYCARQQQQLRTLHSSSNARQQQAASEAALQHPAGRIPYTNHLAFVGGSPVEVCNALHVCIGVCAAIRASMHSPTSPDTHTGHALLPNHHRNGSGPAGRVCAPPTGPAAGNTHVYQHGHTADHGHAVLRCTTTGAPANTVNACGSVGRGDLLPPPCQGLVPLPARFQRPSMPP